MSTPLRPSALYTPRAAVESTFESMSLATREKLLKDPKASNAVITIEYGSSPVDAALHQTFQDVDDPFDLSSPDRISK